MPWSRNTSWRQGSVLAQEDFLASGLTVPPDSDLAVAISHDCDIANENLGAEPAVEFIFARIIKQHDGNHKYGKNPRVLHLDYKYEGTDIVLELLAAKKVAVPKGSLEAILPDLTYSLISSRDILQSWLAARYRRHALPNSLVERLREVFRYIEKNGKKNSAEILSYRLSYSGSGSREVQTEG